MERRPAVGFKCGVGILHVFQVKDHHQERSNNNTDCSPSHLAHYIKKTVTVRFILDHPVYIYIYIYIYYQACHASHTRAQPDDPVFKLLQSSKTHVACVWDWYFPMKITAQISDEYSLYDVTNIRLRFYAVFHSPT